MKLNLTSGVLSERKTKKGGALKSQALLPENKQMSNEGHV